jgi:hypothetical protein
MPLDIGYCLQTKKIVIKTPCPMTSTPDVWVFDNDDSKHSNDYQWMRVMAINPDYGFKGIPRGCQLFVFQTFENNKHNIQISRSRFADEIACTSHHPHDVRFIAFVYPFPRAVRVFLWEELDFWGQKETFGLLNPPDLNTVYSNVDTPYRHSVLYFMESDRLYNNDYVWTCTKEYLCYPQLVENVEDSTTIYDNYASCASSNAHRIKNKRVWVQNSNDPFFEYVKWWNHLSVHDKKKSLQLSNGHIMNTNNDWVFYVKIIIDILFLFVVFLGCHVSAQKSNKFLN